MYWKLKQWIREGGALEPHKDWMQLTKIKYKEDAGKKIKIMPKVEMRLRGLISASESPDTADALALTFAPRSVIIFNTEATAPYLAYYPELGF